MKFLNKNWLILLGALALGAFATYLSNTYISHRISEAEALLKRGNQTVRVVVAKKDMARGDRITPDTVAVRNIPRKYSSADAVTPNTFDTAEDRRLDFPLRSGEELLWEQLEGGKAPTFSARLSKGRRAITFPVDEVNSISGMVRPGDKIDLIATMKDKDRNGKERDVVFPLLQDVPVLATGQQVGTRGNADGQGARPYTTITLETTPGNAKRIILAESAGKLTAVLRNPDDAATAAAGKVDVATLLGRGNVPGTTRPAVEIIAGGLGAKGGPLLIQQ